MKKGFTLIELIVVIAILGILALVLLPKFSGFTDNARQKSAVAEAKSCQVSVTNFKGQYGGYPKISDSVKLKECGLPNPIKIGGSNKPYMTEPHPTSGEFIYISKDNYEVKVTEGGIVGEAKKKS